MNYYELLGLQKEPFSTTPDPYFFYRSPQHQDDARGDDRRSAGHRAVQWSGTGLPRPESAQRGSPAGSNARRGRADLLEEN